MTKEQIDLIFSLQTETSLLKVISLTQNARVYPNSYTKIDFFTYSEQGLLYLVENDGSELYIDFVDINSISFYDPNRPAGPVLEGLTISG
jgi:hypothetical protein